MKKNNENSLSYDEIKALCAQFRIDLINILHEIQTGHPGGSLSACEIITTLYTKEMNIDPQNPNWKNRDRFVLSKGHAAPMLYLNLAHQGFFPKSELNNLRQINSMLQGHPSMNKTPGVDISSGPLGLGLSVACGMAAAAKVNNKDYYTYCLIGDGEMQEGGIWEALLSAHKFNLNNLIILLDYNKVQLDGTTDEIMPLGDVNAKFKAFGLNVISIDGHNPEDISNAVSTAKRIKDKVSIIVANTVKGKGISFMEGKNIWHGSPISPDHYQTALKELGGAK